MFYKALVKFRHCFTCLTYINTFHNGSYTYPIWYLDLKFMNKKIVRVSKPILKSLTPACDGMLWPQDWLLPVMGCCGPRTDSCLWWDAVAPGLTPACDGMLWVQDWLLPVMGCCGPRTDSCLWWDAVASGLTPACDGMLWVQDSLLALWWDAMVPGLEISKINLRLPSTFPLQKDFQNCTSRTRTESDKKLTD
jgi:hypothetical protein